VLYGFVLHGGATSTTNTALLFGLPAVTGVVAAALAVAAVLLAGWRAGFVAAALGGLLLCSGLAGDMVTHSQHQHHRNDILERMTVSPSTVTAHQLMELDEAEARNVWHFATAGGQALVMSGFAGAALTLWWRGRPPAARDGSISETEQQAA
jgi:hypothetical protein